LFAGSDLPLDELAAADLPLSDLLAVVAGAREHRRDRLPRAFEHAAYTFGVTANFGAYRDLQRHRLLTQERQLLTTHLGFDVPAELHEYGAGRRFEEELTHAAEVHGELARALGDEVAQYAVPLAFRLRWYMRLNLRELCHLVELRTTEQGHPDYREVAQRMFLLAAEVHPELTSVVRFVDLEPGAELGRRTSERRAAERRRSLDRP
ncbi:MAG: FAD-dependent thymidylate synthase, partial [Candidatus Dormibacteraceae bacterium]